MIYAKETYELVKKLDAGIPKHFRILTDKYGDAPGIDLYTTDSELIDAVLMINREMHRDSKVLLEMFLYSFDVNPVDMQRCYAFSLGWGFECSDCTWWDGFIDYAPVYHEICGNDVVFYFKFNPPPCSGINECIY